MVFNLKCFFYHKNDWFKAFRFHSLRKKAICVSHSLIQKEKNCSIAHIHWLEIYRSWLKIIRKPFKLFLFVRKLVCIIQKHPMSRSVLLRTIWSKRWCNCIWLIKFELTFSLTNAFKLSALRCDELHFSEPWLDTVQ